MSGNRPIVLSIAGFDPTGGAGVLADIKTFEQHKVNGFGINTANTIQTENEFYNIQWTSIDFILESIICLFNTHTIDTVKIGIIPSLSYLKDVITILKKYSPTSKIIWDPILKSSTDFNFLDTQNKALLNDIIKSIYLITPNYIEMLKIFPNYNPISNKSPTKDSNLLLKGGHNPNEIGVDYLYYKEDVFKLTTKNGFLYEKHGSGCVLSSSIAANLALGQNLNTACINGKKYTENFLLSNSTKLGFHHV
jgi:hydroxymethylpyrimidine/phosphomethylpyrimidine kinase